MTFKSDGKSPNEGEEIFSEKFTQGAGKDDAYEPHDITDTQEFRSKKTQYNFYIALGVGLVFILFCFLNDFDNTEDLNQFRDQTLAKQERVKQEGPFQDA